MYIFLLDIDESSAENVYATIESVRKKRRAPKPPVTQTMESEEDRVTTIDLEQKEKLSSSEKLFDIECGENKILRGDVIYSTINKKKRLLEALQSGASLDSGNPKYASSELIDPEYMNSKSGEDQFRDSAFSENNSHVYKNENYEEEDEEDIYSLPPDA